MSRTILCIDDHEHGLFIRKLMLQRWGHTVLTAANPDRALSILRQTRVDAVVVDYHMAGMDGATLSSIIRHDFPRLPIVLLSGFAAEVPKHLRRIFNAVVSKGQTQTAMSLRKILEDVMAREPKTSSGKLSK